MAPKFKVLLLIVVIAALGTLGIFLVGNTKNISEAPKIPQNLNKPIEPLPTATPTIEPLDLQSADTELEKIDSELNETLNQMNADLNAIDQINASLDNIAL